MSSEKLSIDEKALIRSTAFAVLRNGATFFEWLRNKRKSDPSYVFLYGGVGSEYYKWCLANSEEARKEEQIEKEDRLHPGESGNSHHTRGEERSSQRRERSPSRSISRSRDSRRKHEDGVIGNRTAAHRRRSSSRSLSRSPVRDSRRFIDRQRSHRARERSVSHRRARSPRRRSREYRRRSRSYRRRSRSPRRSKADEAWGKPKSTRLEAGPTERAGKMYAWSDDEKPASDVLREKLAAMKQKLTSGA